MKRRSHDKLRELGLELGAAELNIELDNGIIYVTNTSGTKLFEGPAKDGVWNKLVKFLESNGIERTTS